MQTEHMLARIKHMCHMLLRMCGMHPDADFPDSSPVDRTIQKTHPHCYDTMTRDVFLSITNI